MKAKKGLAHTITTGFHSAAEADAAAAGWATQFQQKGVAEDIPEVVVDSDLLVTIPISNVNEPAEEHIGTILNIAKLLHTCGLASSAGEATRKLQENAVSINGQKFSGRFYSREKLGKTPTIRLGKKSVRVIWSK
jgi:tyrosyl-tRNA synthetase